MTAEVSAAPRPRGTRKQQLGAVAANLFLEHGYLGVGVNDIATAAGISGPALYRHFPSKQALLAHVLLEGIGHVQHAASGQLHSMRAPRTRLDAFATALAEVAVTHRGAAALWRWEGRHLAEHDREQVLGTANEVMTDWVALLREARPELSASAAQLRCWAALSVFGSVAVHRTSLPKRQYVPLIARLAMAVLDAHLPSSVPPRPVSIEPDQPSTTKREELLAAATTLFRRHGFPAVSVEEIGQSVGLAAASVYRHFPSKADMLLAACHRMAATLRAEAEHAVMAADNPAEALDRLLTAYVDIAADNRDLLAVYSTDTLHLPRSRRAELTSLQRDYVAHWVELDRRLRPARTERASRIAVHATLTIVNDLVRTGKTWRHPQPRAELIAIGRQILLAEPAEPPSNDPGAESTSIRATTEPEFR
ncbi:TetR family transcriptional regulator [Tamaricihabitans halophyticus]|uniref:TetR family transcriptional regulator n=1 Tax=Tamaricihabitans halophyticus TaxID=1262583 RepID=A0A4R2QGT0_9PSEU|nr:TetR/AcrR family transcriptional regulator [Tamaricihabitans halophyticus]TCP47909.1 TetR family transcriptional regulator [Tamaricihabitans halophyticus]